MNMMYQERLEKGRAYNMRYRARVKANPVRYEMAKFVNQMVRKERYALLESTNPLRYERLKFKERIRNMKRAVLVQNVKNRN